MKEADKNATYILKQLLKGGGEKHFLWEDRLKTWSYKISNCEEQEQQPAEVVKTKGDGRGGVRSPLPPPCPR